MRAPILVAAMLGGAPVASLACSCWGTQPIGDALTAADAVVVGTVESHEDADYSSGYERPELINVQVIASLKGGVNGNIEIAKTLMCYQSFPEDDLEIGKSYVFPLKRIDLANPDDALGLMIVSDKPVPSHKMYRLPVCSHNALLLDGQGLYTNELTPDGGRKIEYYLPLFLVRVLLPFGLLSTWGVTAAIVIAALVAAAFIVVRTRRRKATHAV